MKFPMANFTANPSMSQKTPPAREWFFIAFLLKRVSTPFAVIRSYGNEQELVTSTTVVAAWEGGPGLRLLYKILASGQTRMYNAKCTCLLMDRYLS